MSKFSFVISRAEGSSQNPIRLQELANFRFDTQKDAKYCLMEWVSSRKKMGCDIVEISENTFAVLNESNRVSRIAEVMEVA